MKIPILAYHPYQAGDPRDILAFEEHLAILAAERFTVLPLRRIVQSLWTGEALPERTIGISCDDGKRYDYHPEPVLGKSMYSVLREFRRRHRWRQRQAALSCFVIADAAARLQIGLGDPDLLGADWWPAAAATGFMVIENHGLDHVHSRVEVGPGRAPYRNDFSLVDTLAEADRQIALAARIIDHRVGRDACRLFAYPFGHTSAYLVEQYFPDHGERHGMLAALTTAPEPVTRSTNRWLVPRYVVNHDLKSSADLLSVLRDCARTSTAEYQVKG